MTHTLTRRAWFCWSQHDGLGQVESCRVCGRTDVTNYEFKLALDGSSATLPVLRSNDPHHPSGLVFMPIPPGVKGMVGDPPRRAKVTTHPDGHTATIEFPPRGAR